MTVPYSRTVLLAFILLPTAAQAWDPNEGANYMPRSRYQSYQQTPMYPERVSAPMARSVPAQNLAAPSYTPPKQAYVPTAPAAPAFVPPTPAPAPVYAAAPAPASAYVPPAPALTPPPPPPVQAAPAYSAPAVYGNAPYAGEGYAQPVASSAAVPGTAYEVYVPPMKPAPEPVPEYPGRFFGSAGLTYYGDTYEEPGLMETDTNYFGLVGSFGYKHQGLLTMLDASMATGEADYTSNGTGSAEGIREYEFDNRLLFGMESDYAPNQMFTYYTGLGHRYYDMKLKGVVTTTGALGYDRRISQLYIPVGMKYSYLTESGWHLRPGAEFDWLFWGNVSSRLRGTGIAGLNNVENRQKKGFGLRGEFMIGKDASATNGLGFEFGPYVRYWDVDDSDVQPIGNNLQGLEPANERTQFGVSAKMLF